MATREQVAAAVFALVDVEAGNIIGVTTSSRRFRNPADVSPAEMPAIFQLQGDEDYERTEGKLLGLPPKRTLHFELAVYVADSQESTVVVSTSLNNIIDQIETAFAPDATTGKMTLGGLVASARIDGKVKNFENLAGDGKSIAVIPIVVIRP